INENPVDLFDLDAKGNLIAMPQAIHYIEVTVAEISGQLRTAFTPTLVVEVSDTEKRSKFENMNFKFISDYFAPGTAVTLGWLIDPKQKRIWVYKRDQCGNIIRNEHRWENIDGGDTLPGFVLSVQKIDYAISQAPTPEASEDEYELKINCPECIESFTERY
ncbi:567_t:CDS:2, partial [Scutellospora calospora]